MVRVDDWVSHWADEVYAEAQRRQPGGTPQHVLSGTQPLWAGSNLGNLRELMTPHLVADEIRRRGKACRHIWSWDDYDRFRRVPAGYSSEFSEYIGRPLTSVPDPCGKHQNWAEHFKERPYGIRWLGSVY